METDALTADQESAPDRTRPPLSAYGEAREAVTGAGRALLSLIAAVALAAGLAAFLSWFFGRPVSWLVPVGVGGVVCVVVVVAGMVVARLLLNRAERRVR